MTDPTHRGITIRLALILLALSACTPKPCDVRMCMSATVEYE